MQAPDRLSEGLVEAKAEVKVYFQVEEDGQHSEHEIEWLEITGDGLADVAVFI